MRQRWLPVALVAVAIFVVNAVARFISWKGHFTTESQQITIGFIGVAVVAAVLAGVSARWSYRYPFPRVLGEMGLATLVGAVLAMTLGPFFGGSKPFAEGLGFLVGQFLLFLAVGAVGIVLGFLAMVVLGRDVRSRRLLRAEQHYGSRRVARNAR